MSNEQDAMKRPSRQLAGPLTGLGAIAVVVVALLDQAAKLWLLRVVHLGPGHSIRLTPFLDLVLVWNTGISYGWFQQGGPAGQWILLAVTAVAVVLLWMWLARAPSRLSAFALGLIIGGAVGNAIDRLAYGAVVDFVLFHLTTASWTFRWYAFNVADAAIVAGVAALLYDSWLMRGAAKAP